MLIRCWGARGSIPVSGREYLVYGGDTTCMEIRSRDDDLVIIDAGTGIRRLGKKLLQENRLDFTMLFTHSHLDHLMGFPFFRPIYLKETRIHTYGCPFEQESVKKMIGGPMTPPYFPVQYSDIQAQIDYHDIWDDSFHVGPMEVTATFLSHPNQGIGYKFTEDGKTFVFLTDNELMYKHPGGLDFDDYVRFAAGTDFLIHDAEYTAEEYEKTRTWGHSTYQQAVQLALAARVKRLGLFHHNQDRSDEAVDAIVADCRRLIAEGGATMECFGVTAEMELRL